MERFEYDGDVDALKEWAFLHGANVVEVSCGDDVRWIVVETDTQRAVFQRYGRTVLVWDGSGVCVSNVWQGVRS